MTRQLLIGCLSWLILLPVVSQKSVMDYPSLTLPSNRTYQIAFSELEDIGLSTANSYLRFSIPLLLKEKTEGIPEHFFSQEQLAAIRLDIIKQALAAERKRLFNLQKTKDAILFSKSTASIKKEELLAKELEIISALQYIHYLKASAQVETSIPEKIPVSIKSTDLPLLERFEYSLLQYTRKNKIDLLIQGSVEEIGDYIALEIRVFDTILGKESILYKNIAEWGEIYQDLDQAVTEIRNFIVGRAWSTLRIVSDFPDAGIYVNNELKGFGKVEIPYLSPQTVLVKVAYPGYFQEEQEVSLVPYETRLVEISLKAMQLDSITIHTNPEGADLYLNSLWSGKTPLVLEKKAGLAEIILVKEGFNNYKFSLDEKPGNPLHIDLIPDSIDPIGIQKKKRNDFYFAMGLWLVTLPFPMFYSGYADDYLLNSSDPVLNQTEKTRLKLTSEALRNLQYCSVAVNIGFAVNMGIRFFRYIDASNKLVD